jgi:hypothetical protein
MNRTEPIRKPFDKQTRNLKKNRRIARSIDRRIFSRNGTQYLISRAPDFNVLVDLLAKLTPENFKSNWKAIDELAFAGGSDGQLTDGVLSTIHNSIACWKNETLSRRGRAAKIELREVSRLEKRARFCTKAQDPRISIFVLDANQEERFSRVIKHPKCIKLTEFEKFVARIVYWFSGNVAVGRYVTALNSPLLFEEKKIEQLDSMLAWLRSLQRRAESEPLWLIKLEFGKNKTFQKMIQWARKVDFDWTPVSGTLPEKIQSAIDKLVYMRQHIRDLVDSTLPTTIAAWAICDQGTGPLPRTEIELTRFRLRHMLLKETAAKFVEVSGQLGYDRLLKMIDGGKYFSSHDELFAILRMLNDGAAVNDCLYVSSSVGASWVGYDVEVKRAKRLIEQIRRITNQPGGALDSKFHRLFVNRQALQIGELIFGWLDSFPKEAISERALKIIGNLLEDSSGTVGSSVFGPLILGRLKLWSSRQQSRREAVENESQWPVGARQWVRRLGYYQRMTGEDSRVPKSLQCLLKFDEKRSKELAFLQAQSNSGTITQVQQIRLVHLLSSPVEPKSVSQSRYERTAQDVCLLTGLDALRRSFVDSAKEVWHRVAEHGNEKWSLARWIAMAKWTCDMSTLEKRLMCQTMEAWKEHDKNYKRHLPFNQSWIRESRDQFSNIKNWLNPKPFSTKVNDQRLNFEVVIDPIETYQMGTYFNTCLSQGGCNEMSVLPNAAEANKQVVFCANKRGELIARQLLAITKDFKIVGYYVYGNLKDSGIDRDSLEAAFKAYADQIATQCGLKLNRDEEPLEPENLSKLYWYDDDVVSWK